MYRVETTESPKNVKFSISKCFIGWKKVQDYESLEEAQNFCLKQNDVLNYYRVKNIYNSDILYSTKPIMY